VKLNPTSVGTLATAALHAAVLAALLSYAPARSAMLAAAPIMVDWLAAPKAEPALEPAPAPKPKPVHKKPELIEKPKVVTAPAETPSPVVVPAPPPPPPEPIALAPSPAPAPVDVAPPVFNAAYLQNPKPPYSSVSKKLGEQGRVVLRVHVNPNGSADEVQLQTSSGFARLDESARTTVGRWKFVPAKRGNEPVSAWVVIPISFKLDS